MKNIEFFKLVRELIDDGLTYEQAVNVASAMLLVEAIDKLTQVVDRIYKHGV